MNEIARLVIRGILSELYYEIISNQFTVEAPWNSNEVYDVVDTKIIRKKLEKYEEMLKE